MNLAHVGVIHDDYMPGTWTFGSFGSTHPEVLKATGRTEYDIEMVYDNGAFKQYGVLDKTSITIWGFYGYLEELEWVDEQGLEQLKESRDPLCSSSCATPKSRQVDLAEWCSRGWKIYLWTSHESTIRICVL